MSIVSVFVLPIFSYVFLKQNFMLLEDESFRKKFGSLYGNLNPSKTSAYKFTSLFCLNRLVISIASVFMQQTSIGSTIPYLVSSIISTSMIIHQKPMNTNLFNCLEYLNQGFVIITAVYMLFCTDWLVFEP